MSCSIEPNFVLAPALRRNALENVERVSTM
jgi:hypothetical protein